MYDILDGDIIMWEEEEEEEQVKEKDEAETEGEAVPEGEAVQEEKKEEKDVKKTKNEIETESDSPLLELTDDLEQLQNLPMFKPERALSVSSLKPFSGFMCELCDRTFETEELSQVCYILFRNIFVSFKDCDFECYSFRII